jgi:hypothetical protein
MIRVRNEAEYNFVGYSLFLKNLKNMIRLPQWIKFGLNTAG